MRISDWSSDVCSSDLIEDFYVRRRRPGNRKSRHVFTNVWVRFEGDDEAVSESILSLYATDGDPEASAHPISILDYTDTLVKQPDGSWRFSERRVTPAFGHMPRIMERNDA